MSTPKIQALGITQPWSTTRWKTTGYVESVGWLEAWGTSLIGAMKALQALPPSVWPSRKRSESCPL